MSNSYSLKLKNPKWQQKRLKILERDEWMCQACQETEKTLHVHHLCYEKGKEPWDYKDSNFVTLCDDCHSSEHANRKIMEDDILSIFKDWGFLYCGDPSLGSIHCFLCDMQQYGGWNPITVFDVLSWLFKTKKFVKIEKQYFAYLRKNRGKNE